jgi:hypothetical protein
MRNNISNNESLKSQVELARGEFIRDAKLEMVCREFWAWKYPNLFGAKE